MMSAPTDSLNLPYDPELLDREMKRHYISASNEDIMAMLERVGLKSFADLYSHIPDEVKMGESPRIGTELEYFGLAEHLKALAEKNTPKPSFLGDALPVYKTHPIVEAVSAVRKLTTSYTAYQPERSQGTLIAHWIYQNMLAKLTGFEAINASLYDRSTALFEAMCCALRLKKRATTVLVSEGIFPQDRAVIDTMLAGTEIVVEYLPLNKNGQTDLELLKEKSEKLGERLGGVVYMQVNQLGLLEDVDALTDMVHQHDALAIACIDPMHLVTGGLKPPTEFGQHGADIIAGEGQHLAIGANFGGPGLGIFGVRHNADVKNHVRATPGRYVGKGLDVDGRDAYVMVLSTREQHIRKEKATSNICSNQAFLATLAGASILARGETGLAEAGTLGVKRARDFAELIRSLSGVDLLYRNGAFYNEVLLKVETEAWRLIEKARNADLHVGVDMEERIGESAVKVAFTDLQTDEDVARLKEFFKEAFSAGGKGEGIPEIEGRYLRKGNVGLPSAVEADELAEYYKALGELNMSPDGRCYPLGSCTMKYNPYINDWAAGLPGFTELHPEAPEEDAQGSLEVLYEIQELFKKITGLAGVTTQPVAGAQGELVGLKLFQAYQRDLGESQRNVVLIPKSAHGTNFATAVMAGVPEVSIVQLDANAEGTIDMAQLDRVLLEHRNNLLGIMVTNPNTSGIFEKDFQTMARKVHAAGGLVYMDGANMNAIAGWIDLRKLGVDAVHQNLHKTWTIPHGGGGPGDAVVGVSEKLVDYLPGKQIEQSFDGQFRSFRPERSIGDFHRHWGNFAHKVRAYTYIKRLGEAGVRKMSGMAVLSARYLFERLKETYPTLPAGAEKMPRMHEFILTLEDALFDAIEQQGLSKAAIIPRVGKLFLDFGYHAPTVAFPEPLGLMVEPTESYTKAELDHFAKAIESIRAVLENEAEEGLKALEKAPQRTPLGRVDEVGANRQLILSEAWTGLPGVPTGEVNAPSDDLEAIQQVLLS